MGMFQYKFCTKCRPKYRLIEIKNFLVLETICMHIITNYEYMRLNIKVKKKIELTKQFLFVIIEPNPLMNSWIT